MNLFIRSVWALWSVCFIAMAVGLGMLLTEGTEAETAPTVVGKTVTLAWDAPTTNVDGTPYNDAGGYEVAIAAETADLNGSDQPLETATITDPAVTEFPFSTTVASGRYSFWVRAFDRVGNNSVWTGPVITTIDSVGPNPPINLTIKITINIGG